MERRAEDARKIATAAKMIAHDVGRPFGLVRSLRAALLACATPEEVRNLKDASGAKLLDPRRSHPAALGIGGIRVSARRHPSGQASGSVATT
jgi:hypothetical protein